ncbi:hypothetical protein [Pseudomonas sp. TUM22785]|uniref:hypothetical protein n=1 Tax=Pseudomonas sp. TUM22785 TaxID=3019098 RepID=UPI0023062F7A|nr:hypothetical protein [Pseudomonas sp. TUM22785]WCD79167.1 hypothetical protein PI990_24700 [Pseudomonas sp. TUM22785]
MADKLRWRQKRDRDQKLINDCWMTECGYTIALCRLPNNRYTITAPGGSAPFAYTNERDDITPLILAHKQAQAVPA